MWPFKRHCDFRYRAGGRRCRIDGLRAFLGLADHPEFLFEMLTTPLGDELETVRNAAFDVFGAGPDEALEIVKQFDEWADGIRERWLPLADFAAIFGADWNSLTPEQRFGLYLNIDRAEFRKSEQVRRGIMWAHAPVLPDDWCRALTRTADDAAALRSFHAEMSKPSKPKGNGDT